MLSHRYPPHWISGILNVKSWGHRWRKAGEDWEDQVGGDQPGWGGGVKFCGYLDGVAWCGGHFFGGEQQQDGERCGAGDGGEQAVVGTAVAADYVDEAGSAVVGSVVVAASDDVGAGDVEAETLQSSIYVAGS